jgi:trimeric autotransporter adhesin
MTRTKAYRSALTKSMVLGFLLAALMALSLMPMAQPAHAQATFTVNSTSDPGGNGCHSTECTLREAITAANRTSSADVINFNILGGTDPVKTISPTSELPAITQPVTIDGYTQPGAKENTQRVGSDAVLHIQLDGSKAGEAEGLRITASNVVVQGLVINRFDGNGITIEGRSATGNTVEGNRIGTDPTGTQALENEDGVKIRDGASGNLIGGPATAARNLISGNFDDGVHLLDGNTNRVENNYLGTDASGSRPLGNTLGVFLEDGNRNTVVGNLVKANTIAFNEDEGVEIRADSTRTRILSNSIFSNTELGIAFGDFGDGDGPTPNDPGDADTGANGLQNKPAIRSAVTASSTTTLKGRLDSTPNTSFIVQFFANPSGNEGKTFIGQKKVTTSSEGKVSFTFTPARKVGAGKTITATATGPEGTSEFSAPRTVVSG